MNISGLLGKHKFKVSQSDISAYLHTVGAVSQMTFVNAMFRPKSGRWYNGIQASAPGEFPAVRSGDLLRSVKSVVTNNSVTLGSNRFYSPYLAYGTDSMGPRAMSVEAMQETLASVALPVFIRAYEVNA